MDSEDHFASNLLHFVTIAILSLFVLEIVLKIYALGIEYFWFEKWEMLDAFVIVVAFTIEITLSAIHANEWKGLELIIVLRLWRVIRLVTVMVTFKEEFYELIEDEIDAKRKVDEAETETESLQKKD
ncbi:voltage-gated hydrogen channel 1-like [Actinia tenebrosa]|uniref:Voltage-gated hydrogen channel 1 n=1 Tax=Actinia tenebrosa TaxID=6105 RepID=A0A6P8IYH3_ACTTE|nr:voltage-gated hydrogen channel 1-like [Actinia tenebrosa]